MNPQEQVCHNPRCWVYGQSGAGAIVVHSRKEQRYQCKRCGKTFSATKETPFYRSPSSARARRHGRHAARRWLSGAGDRRRLRAGSVSASTHTSCRSER